METKTKTFEQCCDEVAKNLGIDYSGNVFATFDEEQIFYREAAELYASSLQSELEKTKSDLEKAKDQIEQMSATGKIMTELNKNSEERLTNEIAHQKRQLESNKESRWAREDKLNEILGGKSISEFVEEHNSLKQERDEIKTELERVEKSFENCCGMNAPIKIITDLENERDKLKQLNSELILLIKNFQGTRNQYSFFMDGYKSGSASISEVSKAQEEENIAFDLLIEKTKETK